MAKVKSNTAVVKVVRKHKKTAQDTKNPKTASMNKSKKASFKKYKGQGR